MEHNKLDYSIKKKLEQRIISPKENTWNRLEMLLEEDEKQIKKTGYLKYVVAASVIFMLGFFFFINQGTEVVLPQKLVDTPVEHKSSNELVLDAAQIKIKDTFKKHLGKNEPIKSNQMLVEKTIKIEKVNLVQVQKVNKKVNLIQDKRVVNLGLLNKKEEEVTAVSGYLGNNKQLNDEVDALLAVAFTNNKLEQPKKGIIDKNLEPSANALLTSVEQELDLSFKNKIFGKLKKGLKNTRTAVINRNK